MRKCVAIFFLVLLVFSNWGYRWVFRQLEQSATARLEQKIDANHYTDDQLLEIKIPLNMPYYSDRSYETVYGETEWQGQYYRYVKRKVSHDTLYLLCVPHAEKNDLAAAKQDYWQNLNDLNTGKAPQKQKVPGYIKLLLSEFTSEMIRPDFTAALVSGTDYPVIHTNCIPQFSPETAKQPPRA